HFAGSFNTLPCRPALSSLGAPHRSFSAIVDGSTVSGVEYQFRTETCSPYLFVAIAAPSSRHRKSPPSAARTSPAVVNNRTGRSAAILENLSLILAITSKPHLGSLARPALP